MSFRAKPESYEARVGGMRKLSGTGTTMAMSVGMVWQDRQAAGYTVALGEPLPAEPTISDGSTSIDLCESSSMEGATLYKSITGAPD